MARHAVTSAEMRAAFPMGAKVAYSDHGRNVLNPRDPDRVGEVVGYAYGGSPSTVCCVKVRWPGCKGTADLHMAFLKLA